MFSSLLNIHPKPIVVMIRDKILPRTTELSREEKKKMKTMMY